MDQKPTIILLYGHIGVGKSTIAHALAAYLGIEAVLFDEVVCELFDEVYGDDGSFLLDSQETQEVYTEMLNRAQIRLKAGKKVILESLYFPTQRNEVVAFARSNDYELVLVHVTCAESEIRNRLKKRYRDDPTSPNIDLYEQYKQYQAIEKRPHISVDTTSQSPQQCVQQILRGVPEYTLSPDML